MNRIAGLVSLSGQPVDAHELAKMGAALRDHRKGAITSATADTAGVLAKGDQPVVRRGPWLLVADARLDNRDELAETLGLASRPARPSDAELLLAAFERWRDGCVEHLRGDFAFAVWDASERALFCARDHFGVKPFLYGQHRGRFVFASEIGPLLAELPATINEERIGDFLVQDLEGYDEVRTFYRHIVRLPPAHLMWVRQTPAPRRYFTLQAQPELRLRDDREYADALLEAFTRAVATRLEGGAAVGSMLSGGLDSSSIVAVARDLRARAGGPALHTFSAVIDDPADVESRCARAVVAQGGLDATFVRPQDLADHLENLMTVARHSHDPFDLTIAHIPLTMYSAARKAGCDVVLDGTPGDLLVRLSPGYVSYLLREGRWGAAIREVLGRRAFMGPRGGHPATLLLSHARVAYTPPWVSRWRRWVWDHEPLSPFAIVAPDFARTTGVHDRLAAMNGGAVSLATDTLAARQARTLRQPWVTAAVERYGRVAAALGIEARHPFLDLRLAQFCLSLPWHQLVNRGIHKIALRRAVGPLLPPLVTWRRPSSHLGPHFTRAWLVFFEGWFARELPRTKTPLGRFVDLKAAREARAHLASGRAQDQDQKQHQNQWRLWLIVCLESWMGVRTARLATPTSPMDEISQHAYNAARRDIAG